jgi:hypothetical protein
VAAKIADEASGLRRFLKGLRFFKVRDWKSNPEEGRIETTLEDSNVVSSARAWDGRHQVVLDIDHPAWLVRSTTPGHYHLYIEVPGGITWADYEQLLRALAACNVIQPGFLNHSINREMTCVRPPWVKKQPGESDSD